MNLETSTNRRSQFAFSLVEQRRGLRKGKTRCVAPIPGLCRAGRGILGQPSRPSGADRLLISMTAARGVSNQPLSIHNFSQLHTSRGIYSRGT
jgi:hypothetical protein